MGPNEVKLYTNDKSGSAGKPTWFVLNNKNLLAKNSIKFINRYKVIVSSAHAVDNSRKLEILDNNTAFGRARLLLKDFETKKESENFYLYCKSEIVRFLFGLSTEGLSGTGNKVPDILDYTDNCKLIDFKKDIDIQLIQHLGITTEELDYMKNNTRINKDN